MFERRLKLFLSILLGVMSLLLLRAVHLQVLTRNQWLREAEEFNKRPAYIETTRGRILDHNGSEIAVDEACMDACVDYRAISRNQPWLRTVAAQRLLERLGDAYRKAPKEERIALVSEEVSAVNKDIDRMWVVLAQESEQSLEQIEEICHVIDLKIAHRSRRAQYLRYQAANNHREGDGPPSWYRRWLIEGGNGGPKVDDFEQEFGEQMDVHPIVKDISSETYIRLAKASDRLPGLVLRSGTARKYPYGRAGAHLVGALAPVVKQDLLDDPNLLDELRKYDFTDLIGRGGIEGLAEPTLRGTRGKVMRRAGAEDELLAAPVPGRDIRCTIDIELQAEIQQLFARMKVPSNKKADEGRRFFEVAMHGAAVVIDVPTGHVRALVSYPDYDVNDLRENYESLIAQQLDAPLMNRATQSQLEPGSTIKPVVGLAAISQGLDVRGTGVMTTHAGIECTGYLVLNDRKMPTGRCWVASNFEKTLPSVAHHPIPIPHKGSFGNPDGYLVFADALERSCNIYFETIGDALGIEGLSYWFEHMGLGRETGLGIAEACGYLPRDQRVLRPSVAWFSAIGQSVRATPIQMANIAATIARDGVWVRPGLIENSDASLSRTRTRDGRSIPERQDLGLNKEAIAAAREGMVRVVHSDAGTGIKARMKEMQVAAKTGTAQAAKQVVVVTDAEGNPMRDGDKLIKRELVPATADQQTDTPWYRGWNEEGTSLNHAWFIGFAPADNPQVAFAVMIEYGGSGNFAAAVSVDILERCIEHGYVKLPK